MQQNQGTKKTLQALRACFEVPKKMGGVPTFKDNHRSNRWLKEAQILVLKGRTYFAEAKND